MVVDTVTVHAGREDLPAVRSIGPSDLKEALLKGFDDFRSMPMHVMFVVVIYPIAGLILSRFVFGYNLLPLLFPLAAGFALLGPVAALGLYEVSRRREQGLPTAWTDVFNVFASPSIGAIATLALVLLAIFAAWLAAAQAIYTHYFGDHAPATLEGLVNQILTQPEGGRLIVTGNLVGLGFALVVLIISVVSFPMLLDRKVGAATAVVTSIRAFFRSPFTMLLWGFIIAVSLFLGALPFFIGLAVVLPVLGHASWHLYRKVVPSSPGQPAGFQPSPLR